MQISGQVFCNLGKYSSSQYSKLYCESVLSTFSETQWHSISLSGFKSTEKIGTLNIYRIGLKRQLVLSPINVGVNGEQHHLSYLHVSYMKILVLPYSTCLDNFTHVIICNVN